MDNNKTATGLYFGALPDLNGLVAYLIEEEDQNMSTIQPLGCRELLFTEPRVLLSPCLENGNQAFMLCKETVLKCSKFKDLMEKLKFKVVRQVDVNKGLFQYCLAFTLAQKLAPLWNKAGEYFIQGRDFFECKSKLNAVSIDVNITDRLCISLKAFNLKLDVSKVDHFCSSANVIQNFSRQRNFEIQQDSIQDELCYVLPSLKKARVVGISHEIPSNSPFSCYEDLRKHWKLMYGYRLPSNEHIFYNVRFFGSKMFTYPSSCIHSNYPQILLRCDQQAIFQAFLQDVQNRIPFICESPLRLTSNALYSSNKLHSALTSNQSSLTRLPPQYKHCTPFVFSQKSEPSNHLPVTSSEISNQQTSSNTAISRPNGAPYIPTFTRELPSKNPDSQGKTKVVVTPRVTPIFKTKSLSSKVVLGSTASISAPCMQSLPSNMQGGHQSEQSEDDYANFVAYNHTMKLPESRPGLSLSRSTIPGIAKLTTDRANHVTTSSVHSITHRVPIDPGHLSTNAGLNSASIERPNQSFTPNSQQFGMHSKTVSTNSYKKIAKPLQRNVENDTAQISMFQRMQGSYSGKIDDMCTGNHLGPNKRQNGPCKSDVAVKKPRVKPKVQEDVDIRQLALNNQLKKVNSITLVNWLRNHNVIVRQKDKKGDLMEKVMNIIKSKEP